MDENKPAFKIFPEKLELYRQGKCTTCGKPITEFRDALSEKEFDISGMCQECQDDVFG